MEGDSKTVIRWGEGTKTGLWRLHHLIYEARTLLKELKDDLHHVIRDQNALVEKLAKWSVNQQDVLYGTMF